MSAEPAPAVRWNPIYVSSSGELLLNRLRNRAHVQKYVAGQPRGRESSGEVLVQGDDQLKSIHRIQA